MNFCPFGALVAHFSTTQMQNCLSSTQEELPLSLAQFGVTASVRCKYKHPPAEERDDAVTMMLIISGNNPQSPRVPPLGIQSKYTDQSI